MKKFEYLSLELIIKRSEAHEEDLDETIKSLEQLDLYGKEGWELVSVIDENIEGDLKDKNIRTFYFKREIN